jgi:hypothetical protein
MSRRAISLTRELWLLLRSLQGQRHLADHAFDLPEGAPAAREILSALSATMALLEARLLMIDRVIRDELDPVLLWAFVNDAGRPLSEGDEPDVHLPEWSARHALTRARQAVKRAKGRHHREKERRAARKASGS